MTTTAKGNRQGPGYRNGSKTRRRASEPKGADYEVGYRKPPVRTRFTKGRSGNPNGRPKETRRLDADIRAELDRVVSIAIEGRQTTISKNEAIARQLFAQAFRGNARAFETLVQYEREAHPDEPIPDFMVKFYPDDQEPPR